MTRNTPPAPDALNIPGLAPPEAAVRGAVATEDWHDLFCAVKSRLRASVAADAEAAAPGPDSLSARRLRSDVLECADALDQLHDATLQQRARYRPLEHGLPGTRASLTGVDLTAAVATSEGAERGLRPPREGTDRALRRWSRQVFQQQLGESMRVRPGQPSLQPATLALLVLDPGHRQALGAADGEGVPWGADVLRVVAARLRGAVRSQDTVQLLDGEVFACLIVGLHDREPLRRLACKLFDVVAAPLVLGSLRLSLCPSIGIAAAPVDAVSPADILDRADAAMSHARRHQSGYAFPAVGSTPNPASP